MSDADVVAGHTENVAPDVQAASEADRLNRIEARLDALEAASTSRGRAMFLSVIAIYAVLAALVVLHWAGHFVRDK